MCARVALTVKLNWGSGEKQSDASAPSGKEAAAPPSRTPGGLSTQEKGKKRGRRKGEQRELTGRLRDEEIDGM